MADVNAEQAEKINFGKTNESQAQAADSTKMRKWKPFINVCTCKNPVTTVMEFRESYQDGSNGSESSGIALNNNNSLVDMSYI
jgi:hypothetical protein